MNFRKYKKKLLFGAILSVILVIFLLCSPLISTYMEVGEIDLNSGNERKYKVSYGVVFERQNIKSEFADIVSKNNFQKETSEWVRTYATQHYLLGKRYTCYNAGAIPPKLKLLSQFLQTTSEDKQKKILSRCMSMLHDKQYRKLEKYINTVTSK